VIYPQGQKNENPVNENWTYDVDGASVVEKTSMQRRMDRWNSTDQRRVSQDGQLMTRRMEK
jgi:hypothetical protein